MFDAYATDHFTVGSTRNGNALGVLRSRPSSYSSQDACSSRMDLIRDRGEATREIQAVLRCFSCEERHSGPVHLALRWGYERHLVLTCC